MSDGRSKFVTCKSEEFGLETRSFGSGSFGSLKFCSFFVTLLESSLSSDEIGDIVSDNDTSSDERFVVRSSFGERSEETTESHSFLGCHPSESSIRLCTQRVSKLDAKIRKLLKEKTHSFTIDNSSINLHKLFSRLDIANMSTFDFSLETNIGDERSFLSSLEVCDDSFSVDSEQETACTLNDSSVLLKSPSELISHLFESLRGE